MSSITNPAGTHARFLQAELDLGFTFTAIASRRYETGYKESAQKSIENAQKAYETVSRFLSDPKHNKRLLDPEIRHFCDRLERLREELIKLESVKANA